MEAIFWIGFVVGGCSAVIIRAAIEDLIRTNHVNPTNHTED